MKPTCTEPRASASAVASSLAPKVTLTLPTVTPSSASAPMSSGGSFLNWLGQYDAAEQDRALERLSAYRASLTDSYDLDMFSRIVAYLLRERDALLRRWRRLVGPARGGLLLSAAAEHGEQRKGKEERKHTLHGQRLLTE